MKDNDSKLIAESWLAQSGFSFPTFREDGHAGHEKDHPGKTCKEDHPNDPSVKGHEDKYEAKTEDKELEEEKEDTIEEAMPSVGAQQLEGYGAQIIQALGAWAAAKPADMLRYIKPYLNQSAGAVEQPGTTMRSDEANVTETSAQALNAVRDVAQALRRGRISLKETDLSAATLVVSTGSEKSIILQVVGYEGDHDIPVSQRPDSAGARHRMSRKSTPPGDIERWSSDQS